MRKLVKALIPRKLFRVIEPYGHLAEAVLANIRYGFPAQNLKVIGVTGTDGKTTTSTLIHAMLADAGLKVGLITTVAYGTAGDMRANPEHMTTASSFKLQRRIAELKLRGIEWLVLETTSHALAQNRAWGVPYSVAVVTNVTHEHLDYHGTWERYRDAKKRLFTRVGSNKSGLGVGIINADDPGAANFSREVRKSLTYGIEAGDVCAHEIRSTATGNDYSVKYESHVLNIHTQLPGTFNVYNSLAAVCVGISLGLSDGQIEQGIASLDQVDGRMNSINEGQDFNLIVDFAHTPASYQKLLPAVRSMTAKRLIAVFGSAGRRDEAKRAQQGEIAGREADLLVLTEEDDRDIDGKKILDQIAEGAEKSGKVRGQDMFLILDRSEAIEFAVQQAQTGDTVILLGKGHEHSIEGPDGERSWDEREVARAAIRKRIGKPQ